MSALADTVTLSGWVHEKLPEPGSFLLRNRFGMTTVDPCTKDAQAQARRLRPEDVVRAEGTPVRENHLSCTAIEVVNATSGIPFTAATRDQTPVGTRSRYRYLEFRDPAVLQLLEVRHRFVRGLSRYLDDEGFISVETPLLGHPSGSGAREFTVHSALRPDVPYALPQSPQVYGQLVAVGGVERYYQLARCFRDEDLRTDRQPEFTQLQVEMAFASRDDVMDVIEGALRQACGALGAQWPSALPRLTYAECLRNYGTDKPDLRLAPRPRLLPYRVTDNSPGAGGDIFATDLPDDLDLTPSWWQRIAPAAATRGMRLLGFLDALESRSFAPTALTSAELTASLRLAPEWQPGLVPIWRGSWRLAHRLVKLLYRSLAQTVGPADTLRFAWVIDFPLFETDPATDSLVSVNHPFCAPADAGAFTAARSRSDLLELSSTSFDLVLNGEELGSGSVVNHRTDIQQRILDLLGVSRSQRDQSFSFVLESMRFGAPPVAGFGLGVDRMVAMLGGSKGIREVIAFPKTKRGSCPVTSRR